jgi:hypothetical protein
VYSLEAEQKRVAQKIFDARMREEANQTVTCQVCKQPIKRLNLASHLQKVHNQIPGQTLKMGDGPSFSEVLASLDKTKKTKKAKKKGSSTDVFDWGLTVSGGAFGNGKRRKLLRILQPIMKLAMAIRTKRDSVFHRAISTIC